MIKMSEIKQIQEMKPYKYKLTVGHMKSGSAQVLVIKELTVQGDDFVMCLSEIKAGLKAFQTMEMD
tara:strand:- start:874 stop:1071 length:198 start_codon:yes stop_codon:yes gene_type:complete